MTLGELVVEALRRRAEVEGEAAALFVHPCCSAPVERLPPRVWKPRLGLLLLVVADGVAVWREPLGWRSGAVPVV